MLPPHSGEGWGWKHILTYACIVAVHYDGAAARGVSDCARNGRGSKAVIHRFDSGRRFQFPQ